MAGSKIKSLLKALLLSYVLTGILLSISAFALYKLKLGESQVNFMVCAIYIITCFAGGLAAGKSIGKRRFLWGFITGFLYFAVLLAASALMGKGVFAAPSELLTSMALCALSGAAGGMIS